MIRVGYILFGAGLMVWFLLIAMPGLGFQLLSVMLGCYTLYYMAIAGGLVKDPLLDYFRRYGDAEPAHPLVSLLFFAAIFCFSLVMTVPYIFLPGSFLASLLSRFIFVALGLFFIAGTAVAYAKPRLRTALPLWYAQLVVNASRQERRHMGWAWLRLPRRMRWRLNGDQRAFHVWADMVRLTSIYGAFDKDSPWHKWT